MPITTWVYYQLRTRNWQRLSRYWLILASFAFYAWWNTSYVIILLASIVFNLVIGRVLMHTPKRWLLTIGVTGNLLLLGYFKYADFFIANVNALFASDWTLLRVALPLAISFFTFQQIAFLVDAYRGKNTWYGADVYILFVVFFPQLIAGPIVHYREVAKQFATLSKNIPWEEIAKGITLLTIGLVKKVILADTIAPWSDAVFVTAEAHSVLHLVDAWGGALAYTLQLYFDFSGYSDMALGLGHMFGFGLPINFDTPYKSLSIGEFWRRWHITLGAFLREYLYIPLGGNRYGNGKTMRNLAITMLLGGLWHGAAWTFVLWGGLHSVYLILETAWSRLGLGRAIPTVRPLKWLMTFLAVMLAWVIFRAESLTVSLRIYQGMVNTKSLVFAPGLFDSRMIGTLLALLLLSVTMPTPVHWVRGEYPRACWRPNALTAVLGAVALIGSIIFMGTVSPFLYFNF
ncbi:MAG: MBOAT family protein [Deinococcota bacterium]